MAGKIIDEDVLKQLTEKLLQVVVDNVYIEEEYDDDSINALFDGTPEQISYYESLINDSLTSENRLWSSKKIAEEIANSIVESNAYADGLITNISSIELKYVDVLPSTGNANTIYILKSTTSDPDTLNLYNDGSWIKIGDFNINLDDYATVNYVNTKLADKANKTEVLAVNKVQTTTGSETNDTVYSSKLTKDELDKKANDTDVVKKTDMSTIIDNTSTNNTVPTNKAVYDSLINKVDNTIVLNTADEVNSFNRTYQSFIIPPTVAEAVGLPKAPDSTWFCINLSHIKGFRYPSQIAFEYAGIERIMYRTAHNGVWHNWRKIPTTSIADVGVTTISWSDETYFKIHATGCYYQVKNGVCYVNIDILCNSPKIGGFVAPIVLPKPSTDYVHVGISSLPDSSYEHSSITMAIAYNGTNIALYGGVAGNRYLGSFSYPVSEI